MGKIEIIKYTDSNRDEWEEFVAGSNNGTMFHRQAFLDYHPGGKFDFYNLMIRKSGKLIGLLPGGVSNNGDVFWSPVGASYGSVVTKDIRFENALEIIDSLMEYFPQNGFKEIFMIPPPLLYSHSFNQHIEYAMLYRKFDFELHYISHAIHLNGDEEFIKKFDKTARKSVNKIIREGEIRIEESEDYESFNEILISNKSRHGVKPTHSLEDMLKLKELIPEQLKLFLVYLDDKPIAGSWLFLTNSKVALCFYNMLLYEYENYRPVYLVMNEVCRYAVENGYEWVDIGVSQDTLAEDPMTPSINLINFKERFAARGILRSTYHFKF